MNHKIDTITTWAHKWWMSINPDPKKQEVEVTFSRKKIPVDNPIVLFENPSNESYSAQTPWAYYRYKIIFLTSYHSSYLQI